jgi:WD40 repeat protein/serine/threonine protein kinase
MHSEEEIFEAAAALPAKERPAYLDEVCAGQPELRARIESLLRSHEVTGFMDDCVHLGDITAADDSIPNSAPVSASEQPGDLIGRYKLMEQIGEGGFGVVWVAEQQEPVRRRVALKIIKPGMDSREVIARFEQERQALAMMEHPNIAKVFDAGATDKGRPFFVMELVRGVRITEYCDQANLPTAERLQLFINVCQAVQHAHQKGIIHRDLKPSNILVTPGDDGQPVPKVIDFGVAKAIQQQPLTDGTVYTQFEQMIGTPAYMSPEQAGLGPMDIDTRSDVYSLGVLLYELLTGRPPFDPKELLRAGLDEMRRVIREVEPPKPSTRRTQLLHSTSAPGTPSAKAQIRPLKSSISPDLDWIVMKALEKDRARRYESATGLAADLRRHMESLPVVARPPGRAYLLSRFIRRHKFGVAAGVAVSLSLLAGLGAALWGKSQAEAEAAKTKLANEANERNLHLASMADYAAAVKALDEDLEATRKGQRALGFMGKSRWHEGVALLVRALEREPGNHQAALKLYDALRTRQAAKRDWALFTLKHDGPVRSAKFSPDGARIVTSSSDGTARLWDAASGQPVGEPMRQAGSWPVASFSPDCTKILTASCDQTDRLEDATTTVRLWDAATGQSIGEPMHHEGTWTTASFSPDGSRVVTAGYGGRARLWDADTGRPVGEPMRGDEASFSQDSSRVVTTSSGHTVQVWDAATGQPIGESMRLAESDKNPTSAVFSPDGAKVVTTAWYDTTVRIWNAATGHAISLPMEMKIEGFGVRKAIVSPDGGKIVSVHHDQGRGWPMMFGGFPKGLRARIWDLETGQPLSSDIHAGWGDWDQGKLDVDFSPDGIMILTAGQDKTARVWDATSGQAIGEPMRHKGVVNDMRFSPDADLVITGSSDGTAQVWDAKTGLAIFVALRHERGVSDVAFSPDRTRVVTASEDGTARIWELPANGMRWVGLHFEGVHKVEGPNPDEISLDDARVNKRELAGADSDATVTATTPAILDWARSFCGLRSSDDGEFHLIPDEERLAAMAAIALPDGRWAELAKWINTPSLQRATDLTSNVTLRQIAERERDDPGSGAVNGTLASLDSALNNDPTVPLARLFFAAGLENTNRVEDIADQDPHVPQRAAFLRRYDLDALARENGKMKNDELAALWVRAAAHLFKLPPETKVGIGPKATTAREEAEKAARKALELVPGLPAAEEMLKQIQGAN